MNKKLEDRVKALEERLPANSWLFGEHFLKRAFGVLGYYLAAVLTIWLGLIIFSIVLGLISVVFNAF